MSEMTDKAGVEGRRRSSKMMHACCVCRQRSDTTRHTQRERKKEGERERQRDREMSK